MTAKQLAKVLKSQGLPEPRTQILIKNVLYSLPMGLVSAGVCIGRKSNRHECKLIVFHQPLYMPFECVAFWKIYYVRRNGYERWPVNEDPQSEASLELVRAIREKCLPIASKGLSLEEILHISELEIVGDPQKFSDHLEMVYSLCVLKRFEEARYQLNILVTKITPYLNFPDKFDKNVEWSEMRTRSSAHTIYRKTEPLRDAFASTNPEVAVAEYMESVLRKTKHHLGLTGIE